MTKITKFTFGVCLLPWILVTKDKESGYCILCQVVTAVSFILVHGTGHGYPIS